MGLELVGYITSFASSGKPPNRFIGLLCIVVLSCRRFPFCIVNPSFVEDYAPVPTQTFTRSCFFLVVVLACLDFWFLLSIRVGRMVRRVQLSWLCCCVCF